MNVFLSKNQAPFFMKFAFIASLFLALCSCQEKSATESNASPTTDTPADLTIPEGMVYIPGGTYIRGNEKSLGTRAQYPEEEPAHEVTVDAFFMDVTEVTNTDFSKFVEATGYLTFAERGLSQKDFPNAPADQLVPGATVFYSPDQPVQLWKKGAEFNWWKFVPGANWRHPSGPDSSITEKMNHPVVCLTKADIDAYAQWIGKRLPTEAEWERAARGGLEQALFTWGNSPLVEGKWMTNCFQGTFPTENTALDGFVGTAPVKSYPPNHYGLYDMAGNVWEVCSDYYRTDAYKLFVANPEENKKGPVQPIDSIMNDRIMNGSTVPSDYKPFHPLAILYVAKGGSFLCHHTYCLRYRPAARHYSEGFTPTNHSGFRLVKDLK